MATWLKQQDEYQKTKEQQANEQEAKGLLMADLDDAPCVICGEIESKSNMEWLRNVLGEEGWVCRACQAEGEKP